MSPSVVPGVNYAGEVAVLRGERRGRGQSSVLLGGAAALSDCPKPKFSKPRLGHRIPGSTGALQIFGS